MKRHGIKIGFLSAGLLVCAALAVLLWNRTLSKQEPYEIVLIQKAMDDTDFWTSVYQGGEMAAQEYNAVLTAVGPEREQDVESQNQMILDAVARKPDAIVLAPCSSDETLPYARQIEETGITLVLLDSTMEEETGKAVVATDNYELGYKMGSYMKQFVEEDTVIGSWAMCREALQPQAGRKASVPALAGRETRWRLLYSVIPTRNGLTS